jgi:hypothetical protein
VDWSKQTIYKQFESMWEKAVNEYFEVQFEIKNNMRTFPQGLQKVINVTGING